MRRNIVWGFELLLLTAAMAGAQTPSFTNADLGKPTPAVRPMLDPAVLAGFVERDAEAAGWPLGAGGFAQSDGPYFGPAAPSAGSQLWHQSFLDGFYGPSWLLPGGYWRGSGLGLVRPFRLAPARGAARLPASLPAAGRAAPAPSRAAPAAAMRGGRRR
jgi:hypothetical protein